MLRHNFVTLCYTLPCLSGKDFGIFSDRESFIRDVCACWNILSYLMQIKLKLNYLKLQLFYRGDLSKL